MESTGETWQVRQPAFELAAARGRVDRYTLLAAAIALVPVALVFVATCNGIGMSYDSVVYASTRRELVETGGWAFSPLWPIGYPVIVALVGTGAGAVAFSCITLWANLMVAHRLALTVTGSQRTAGIVLAWLSVSMATVWTYSMMWSEGAFCLAVNVALLALVHIHRSGRIVPGWVAALVIAVTAAGLLRFAAAALPAAVGVAILLALYPRLRWRALMPAGAVAVACSTGLLFSVARNLAVGAEPTGPRLPSRVGFVDVLLQVPAAASAFLMNLTDFRSITLGIGLVLVVGVLLAAWIRTHGRSVSRHPAVPLAIVTGVYVAFIIASELTTFIDAMDLRIMSPMHAATATLIAAAVRDVARGRVRLLATVGAATLITYGAATSAMWALTASERGGIAQDAMAANNWPGLAESVATVVPADASIVAEFPSVFVLITGRDRVLGIPDAGPSGGEPTYFVGDPLDLAAPSRFVVVMTPSKATESGWQLLSRGDSFSIYQVK